MRTIRLLGAGVALLCAAMLTTAAASAAVIGPDTTFPSALTLTPETPAATSTSFGLVNGPVTGTHSGTGSLLLSAGSGPAGGAQKQTLRFTAPTGTTIDDLTAFTYRTWVPVGQSVAPYVNVNVTDPGATSGTQPPGSVFTTDGRTFTSLVWTPDDPGLSVPALTPGTWQTNSPLTTGKWWCSHPVVDGAFNCGTLASGDYVTWAEIQANAASPTGKLHDKLSAYTEIAWGDTQTNYTDLSAYVDDFDVNYGTAESFDFEGPGSPLAVNAAAPAVTSPTSDCGYTLKSAGTTPTSVAVPCRTVSDGLGSSITGGTLNVADGTYTEQVDITRPVTINGASKAGTKINAPLRTSMHSFTATGSDRPTKYSVITVDSAAPTTTIKNLTVDFGTSGTDWPCDNAVDLHGIFVFNSTATIDNVAVDNVTPGAASEGCQMGRAIEGRNTTGSHTLTVNNSQVTDYAKNGIDVRGSGLTANLTGNTIGRDPTAATASNGIVIGGGAAGTISGNTITGNACLPANSNCGDTIDDTQSSGILTLDPLGGATSVTGNTLTGNDVGVYAEGSSAAPLTVDSNTISGGKYGVFVDSGTGNTVSHNQISADQVGVEVATYDAAAVSATITGNTITAPVGVSFDQGDGGTGNPSGTVEGNDLAGSPRAIDNHGGGTVTAPNNYFGCNGGPGQVGCSSVDGVSVANEPKLVLTLTSSASALENATDSATLTASFARNSAGDTVDTAKLPSGQDVVFTTTLGTLSATTAKTDKGVATATLTAGSTNGTAAVAATSGGQSAVTAIRIGPVATQVVTVPVGVPVAVPVPVQTGQSTTPLDPELVALVTAAGKLKVAASTLKKLSTIGAGRFFARSTSTKVKRHSSMTIGAIACPTVSCEVIGRATVTLKPKPKKGRSNKSKRVTLAVDRLQIGSGQAGLVVVRATAAQLRAIRAAKSAKLALKLAVNGTTSKRNYSLTK